jgi:hypothetical protein
MKPALPGWRKTVCSKLHKNLILCKSDYNNRIRHNSCSDKSRALISYGYDSAAVCRLNYDQMLTGSNICGWHCLFKVQNTGLHKRAARTGTCGLAQTLQAVSPLSTLGRGYAVLRSMDTGSLISAIGQASRGDEILAQLADGSLQLTVNDTSPGAPDPGALKKK